MYKLRKILKTGLYSNSIYTVTVRSTVCPCLFQAETREFALTKFSSNFQTYEKSETNIDTRHTGWRGLKNSDEL